MKEVTGLLVMDVDGTLIRQEGIDLLAQEAGVGEKVAEITAQAMNGKLDFAASLEARVAETLIMELHQRGYKVGLVSGGFHEVIDPIAKSLGIDLVLANRLRTFDGRLTGEVLGGIITPERKKESLLTWAKENHVPRSQTIAMGDGANDLPMIETAGIGIAFMAKPIVAERAPYRIEKRDLSLVLEILDQHRKETACISY